MNKIAKVIIDVNKGFVPAQFSAMSKEEMTESVRKEMLSVFGLETYNKKDFRRALRKNDLLVCEIIEEVIDANIRTGDEILGEFSRRFVDFRTLDLGDENLFYVKGKKDLIVSEFAGGYINARRQRYESGQSFPIDLKNYVISTYIYFEQLVSGRLDLAEFVMALNDAIAKKMKSVMLQTFQAGLTNLPAAYKFSAAYDEDLIIEMLTKLEAVNQARPMLIGTASAIYKLQSHLDFSDNMKDAKNNDYTLGKWLGYDVIVLPNEIEPGTIDTLMLDDKIYCIAGDTKLLKFVQSGDVMVKSNEEKTEHGDLTLNYEASTSFGSAICYSGLAGTIDLL